MKAPEFKKAFAIANNPTIDLSQVENDVIIGYGLHGFKPVTITLEMVAKEIRYHALMMNGKWDSRALDEVKTLSKKSFLIA